MPVGPWNRPVGISLVVCDAHVVDVTTTESLIRDLSNKMPPFGDDENACSANTDSPHLSVFPDQCCLS